MKGFNLFQDDLTLPHAPHTSTIINKVQPTKALENWRTAHLEQQQQPAILTNPLPNESPSYYPDKSPRPSSSKSRTSVNAHLKAPFRIEHSVYISTGGQRASVLRCPSAQAYHKNSWAPNFGGGGMLGKKAPWLHKILSLSRKYLDD